MKIIIEEIYSKKNKTLTEEQFNNLKKNYESFINEILKIEDEINFSFIELKDISDQINQLESRKKKKPSLFEKIQNSFPSYINPYTMTSLPITISSAIEGFNKANSHFSKVLYWTMTSFAGLYFIHNFDFKTKNFLEHHFASDEAYKKDLFKKRAEITREIKILENQKEQKIKYLKENITENT